MACCMEVFAQKSALLEYSDSGELDDDCLVAACGSIGEGNNLWFKERTSAIVTDGEVNSEELVAAASNWNRKLEERALNLVREWFKNPQFDTLDSYSMRKAVEAADNHFSYGAEKGVIYDGGYGEYFCTRIPTDMLAKAIKSPSDYCIFTIAYDD